jgi:hypothetical protein
MKKAHQFRVRFLRDSGSACEQAAYVGGAERSPRPTLFGGGLGGGARCGGGLLLIGLHDAGWRRTAQMKMEV